MSSEFVTGDARTKLVQLTINDATFIIAPTSTVTAQIISKDRLKVLTIEPVECLSTMTGAVWTTSLVAVKFPRASTAGIKVIGAAVLEIQVTVDPAGDAEDFSFFTPITIAKGNLP